MIGLVDMRHMGVRFRIGVVVVAALTVLGLIVGGWRIRAADERQIIREAAAERLRVSDESLEVHSYIRRGDRYVAQLSARSGELFSVAVRGRRDAATVTRLFGEYLGGRSDAFFDTDDPNWGYTCPQ